MKSDGKGDRLSTARRYRLEDLVIDVGRRQVLRGATEVMLPGLSFDLLLELIRAAPSIVSYDELMQRVWSGLVVSPETVTQRVKLVRDAIGDDARAPRYIKGVHGRGYLVIGRVEALPVIENSGQSAGPPLRKLPGTRSIRLLAYAAVAVPVILVATFLLREPDRPDVIARQTDGAHEEPITIAVLPFENLSGDVKDDYLGEGLSEELTNRLANVPGLQVSARTSSAYFKQRPETAQTIGRMLGVEFLVEGSVRRSGDSLRVTVQLIDARTGFHVTSNVLERTASDALAIQDEISLAVLKKLEVPVIEQARAAMLGRSTTSPAALDLYLRARHADQFWTLAENDRAIAFYEKAIALDPRFSSAYLALADALLARTQIAELPPDNPGVARAEALVRRAIELDPDSADGHALMARLLLWKLDLAGAELEIRLAEGQNPSSERALRHLTQYYAFVGWPPDRGIDYANRWFRIDPLNRGAECNIAIAQLHAHRYEDSLQTIDRVIRREPDYWVAHFIRTGGLMELGRLDEALASARREIELRDSVETRNDLAVIHALRGEETEARRILAGLLDSRDEGYFRPSMHAIVAVALGDTEGALAALEQAVAENDSDAIQYLHWRLLTPLHDEPRFRDLVRRFDQQQRLALLIERTQSLPPWPH